MLENYINFFAETNFRNKRAKFGIKGGDDRRRHVYIIGKTGVGKTALMKNMAIQDIEAGRGVCFVDPHGETAEDLLNFVPSQRVNDVIYLDPGDMDFPVAFNVMEKVSVEHRHLAASGLLAVFKKIWPDVWSARMEYILNNSMLALLEYPGSTLLGINRMLADTNYRSKVVEKITDPVIRAFWTQEFARYTQRYEVEATAAIQNKIGQFISAPLIRNIIGQTRTSINMREMMDKQKILIVNLSKGKIGDDVSLLLGGLIITKLQLAAMSRIDVPEEQRNDFFLYVDEFQHFATRAFTNTLSEARKYRLCLTIAHQYIMQMEEEVRDAVFGNVGTIISFRIGAEDAEYLEKEFQPEFYAVDIVNLAKYNIYLKLMINGTASRAFSATTLPPIQPLKDSNKDKIIKVSRERYAAPRSEVETNIGDWLTAGQKFQAESPVSMPSILYDARCSLCGKDTKVTFKPDPSRPIYCKTCMKKVKKGEIPGQKSKKDDTPARNALRSNAGGPKPVSLKQALDYEPRSFSGQKVKKQKTGEQGKDKHLDEVRKALARAMEKR